MKTSTSFLFVIWIALILPLYGEDAFLSQEKKEKSVVNKSREQLPKTQYKSTIAKKMAAPVTVVLCFVVKSALPQESQEAIAHDEHPLQRTQTGTASDEEGSNFPPDRFPESDLEVQTTLPLHALSEDNQASSQTDEVLSSDEEKKRWRFVSIVNAMGDEILFFFRTFSLEEKILFPKRKIPQCCTKRMNKRDKMMYANDQLIKEKSYVDEVTYYTEDQMEIEGLHYKSAEGKIEEGKMVLIFHGKDDTMVSFDYLGELLIDEGYNVFMASYRGYGRKKNSAYQTTEDHHFYMDAEAAIQTLLELGYQKKNIVVLGYSIGASAGIDIASRHKEIAGLVTIGALASLPECSRTFQPLLKKVLRHNLNSKDKIKEVACPIILFHGAKDKIVPPRNMKKLYQAAQRGGAHDSKQEIASLLVDGGHTTLPLFKIVKQIKILFNPCDKEI